MITRSFISILAVSVCSLLPATSLAEAPASAACALEQHRIVAVEPYWVDARVGYGYVSELRGAQVYVQAEPGLTAEWLQLLVRRDLAGAESRRACASFDGDVGVQVVSA